MRSATTQSLAQLYCSIFLMGCAPLFAKVIALPAHEITAIRAVFGLTALGLFLVLLNETIRLRNRRDALLVGLVGMTMAGHWVTYFHSIQVSTVAVALTGFFTFPVITVFLEPLFFRDVSLSYKNVLSALGVFVGAALLVGFGGRDQSTLLGLSWGLASATLLALRNILMKRHLVQYPGTVMMLYQMLIVAVLLLPTMDWSADFTASESIVYLVALGVVFTACAHTLFVKSLVNLPARTVSIVFCMQPLVGVLLAVVLLNEVPAWHTAIGGIIILTVAGLESVRATRTP